MFDLIIKEIALVRPTGRQLCDVAVQDGKISYIGENTGGSAKHIIEGNGRLLLPGAIDTHVHFRDPGHNHKEDWKSGSSAAVSAGVTTVMEMPNTWPVTVSLERFLEKREIARDKSLCNWGIWAGTNGDNADELNRMREAGAVGTKIFMGSSTGPLLCEPKGMQRIFSMDNPGLIGVHAEDEEMLIEAKAKFKSDPCPAHHLVRPPEAALEAVRQLCELTDQHHKNVHICHLSTQMEIELLKTHQSKYITVEACPHHLFLSAESCQDLGNFSKCNPPIRSESDRAALWAALVAGEIDTIGSDHAPHTREEKQVSYWSAPSGLPGVETSLPLMLHAASQGLISYEQVVTLMCARPAEIFKLPQKGSIEVGMDADLVIVRDGATMALSSDNLLSRCDWSPFEGTEMAEKPEFVILNGEVVAQRGQLTVDKTSAKMVQPTCD